MKLIKKITAFFNKAVNWFTELVKMDDQLTKKYAPIGIDVCNAIKTFNTSTEADALTTIIGVISNKWGSIIASLVRAWITNNIDKIISGLNIANAAANANTVAEKIVIVSNYIATLDLDTKSVKWSTISALIAKDLSDSKLSLIEIMGLVTAIYKS